MSIWKASDWLKMKTNKNGKPYFVLRNPNNRAILLDGEDYSKKGNAKEGEDDIRYAMEEYLKALGAVITWPQHSKPPKTRLEKKLEQSDYLQKDFNDYTTTKKP